MTGSVGPARVGGRGLAGALGAPNASLSTADAREALWRYHFPPGSVDEVARRLGTIQYDPLAPMGRNPDLVLQARVPGYRIDDWQAAAYRQRSLVDAWDKMVCLTLIEDWPARHLFHADFERHWGRRVFEPHADAVAATLSELRERGPLDTLAFSDQRVHSRLRGSWYGPKLVKHVLRALWDSGKVVTHDRDKGRHVYHLPERSLPATAIEAAPLPRGEALARLLRRRVQASGLLRPNAGTAVWYMPVPRDEVVAAKRLLVEQGSLRLVAVDGVAYLTVPEVLEALDAPPPTDDAARFLAPLDGLLWDRLGVQRLYRFDYVWEVYKPIAARRWGYYVLPILWRDRFLGRFDGRLRGDTLEITAWYWEDAPGPGGLPSEAVDGLVRGAADFLRYLGAERVRLPRGAGRAARSVWEAALREARA